MLSTQIQTSWDILIDTNEENHEFNLLILPTLIGSLYVDPMELGHIMLDDTPLCLQTSPLSSRQLLMTGFDCSFLDP